MEIFDSIVLELPPPKKDMTDLNNFETAPLTISKTLFKNEKKEFIVVVTLSTVVLKKLPTQETIEKTPRMILSETYSLITLNTSTILETILIITPVTAPIIPSINFGIVNITSLKNPKTEETIFGIKVTILLTTPTILITTFPTMDTTPRITF